MYRTLLAPNTGDQDRGTVLKPCNLVRFCPSWKAERQEIETVCGEPGNCGLPKPSSRAHRRVRDTEFGRRETLSLSCLDAKSRTLHLTHTVGTSQGSGRQCPPAE